MTGARVASLGRVSMAILVLLLAQMPLASQTRATGANTKPWVPTRTAFGQPDLQGMWESLNATPLPLRLDSQPVSKNSPSTSNHEGGDMAGFSRVVMTAAVGGLLMIGRATAIGQAPASPGAAAVIGTGMFTPIVENMDRSLAFYHDVFGMEVPPLPASGSRPYNNPNPRLFAMFDIPGAKERHQSARVPGIATGVEPMEIQDVDHKTIRLRIQDPGVATLVLLVRDIDAAVARLKQANIPIVTPSGSPVRFPDGSRAVLIRDVDNRFIEVRQPASLPTTAAPATSNIVDIRLSISVNDIDRTKTVYKDVLGFRLEGETAFAADTAMQALTGLSTAEVRRSRVRAQGSALWIEFVEFKGVDRTPLRMRIQDRGAARLQLRTPNIDTMVNVVKGAGLTVVSHGSGAVPIPPNFRGALVADPNNFFVSLFEPCDGCAPRTLPSSR